MPGEYLLILFGFLLSGLFLEWRYRIQLYHSRRERFIIPLIFLIIGIAWDNFAVWRQHWIFPGEGLIGIQIGLVPIE